MNEYIYGINPEEEFDEDYEDEQEYWDWLYGQENGFEQKLGNPFEEYASSTVKSLTDSFVAYKPVDYNK